MAKVVGHVKLNYTELGMRALSINQIMARSCVTASQVVHR